MPEKEQEKEKAWQSVTLKRSVVKRARAAGVDIQVVCEKALNTASEALEKTEVKHE